MPKEVLDKVWFMDSFWYDFISPRRHEDVGAIKNYLQGLDMSQHYFLFLPIVNRYALLMYVIFKSWLYLIVMYLYSHAYLGFYVTFKESLGPICHLQQSLSTAWKIPMEDTCYHVLRFFVRLSCHNLS